MQRQQSLTVDQARRLIAQSALGAAKMASQQTDDFATLRQNITSKGGTTAAALQHFHAGHFDELVNGAIQACIHRSQEMEQSL